MLNLDGSGHSLPNLILQATARLSTRPTHCVFQSSLTNVAHAAVHSPYAAPHGCQALWAFGPHIGDQVLTVAAPRTEPQQVVRRCLQTSRSRSVP